MSFIVTFIAAVFVFSAVIAIHEFGHFMVPTVSVVCCASARALAFG